MNWEAPDEDSENEMFQMSSSRIQEDGARVRLLSLSDEEPQTSRRGNDEDLPQLHFRRHVASFPRIEEERKFKLALISILIGGISLIITINIGLGIRLKNMAEQDALPPVACNQENQHIFSDKHCEKSFPWQFYRLPNHVHPKEYNIFLHPNLTEGYYSGSVNIVITVNQSTDLIILHSKNQYLMNIVVFNGIQISKNEQSVASMVKQKSDFTLCSELEFLAIHMSELLVPEKDYTIHVDFKANFSSSLMGFYISKYKTESGENRTIATTQFESTAARTAFPCFDEPTYKSNFTLTMVRRSDEVGLFNTPVSETSDFDSDLKQDLFETTVAMSTYLVAFILSDFTNISREIPLKGKQILVSIYAPQEKIEKAALALDIACKTITYYEKVFEVPYPLPKLDLVAIPDFQAGAMENWGLVTYRETLVLYDPNTSSTSDMERVALVITHELAHQWFGNLVTMQWWNDLWLNEGFASYVEYYGLSKIMPEWKIMQEFHGEHTRMAMSTDQSTFTHPISVPVGTSEQIDEVFDDISYSKGGCVIAMLISYLGEELFFNGIGKYLREYAYRNTVNRDLIDKVANEAKNDEKQLHIKEMMNSWTTQPGFPVVNVSRKGDQVTVSQDRYLLSAPETSAPGCPTVMKSEIIWQIPLSYITDLSPKEPTWQFLDKQQETFMVTGSPLWIKFNFNRGGYYVVNYSPDILNTLIDKMKNDHTIFSASDRSGILFDIAKSAKAGYVGYDRLLDVLTYMRNEDEYEPVLTASHILEDLKSYLRMQYDTEAYQNLQLFIKKMFSNLYNKYGWQGTYVGPALTNPQKKLRRLAISATCSTGHKDCQDEAFQRFKLWRDNNTKVPMDERSIVYSAGIQYGTLKDWDHIWKVYTTDLMIDASEKKKLLSALCWTKDERKIEFLLDESLKGVAIRLQDLVIVVRYLSDTRSGTYTVWKFVREKWKNILDIVAMGSFATRYIIKTLLDNFTDRSEIAGAKEFFSINNISDIRSVRRALDSAKSNVNWIENYQPEVVQWLKDNVGDA